MPSSQHHALLIGIDHYMEYRLPGGIYYPKLGGCVRDITKVYSFLTERIKVAPANILKLTASRGGITPLEPESEWPTYNNIVAAFDELTQRVQAEEQVYIQYSGHGGRTTTMFPAIKGDGEFDETLVPLDIGKPDDPAARYLRDVEIHELIQRLVEKGVRLTVVFDCCHSGGVTRDAAVSRGIALVDPSPAPHDSKVAPIPELLSHWQGTAGSVERGMQAQSDWRFEAKGYTLFAACRANESAFEFPFNGRESNGALTYWLLDTLSNAGPDFTWKMAADRVTAKVHGQFAAQTPMLQGEIDYKVFGNDRLTNQFAVAVLEVNPQRGEVRLAAGEAHGLGIGTRFAVYPVGITTFDSGDAQPIVEITTVQEVEAWAKVVAGDLHTIDVGAQAVMLNAADVKLQRDVRVEIADSARKQQVEATIRAEGKGFVALTSDRANEYLIQIIDGAFVISDSSGQRLPHLTPPLRIDDNAAIQELVKRLIHLVKYQNVLALDMPDPVAQAMLKVELVTPNTVVQPGDQIRLRITNTQAADPANINDPTRFFNISILMLSSNWGVSQIYPETVAFEPLGPGNDIEIDFVAYLPDGESESHDIFKVFATRDTTDFRWLALPALGEPPIAYPGSRDAISDPLEQLLAAITGEEATSRLFKLVKSSSSTHSWTTASVTLHVDMSTESID